MKYVAVIAGKSVCQQTKEFVKNAEFFAYDSADKWNACNPNKLHEYDAFIIDVNPNWDLKGETDFGFDIAFEIRVTHRIRVPIIFTSPFSTTHFSKSGNYKAKIISTTGHQHLATSAYIPRLSKESFFQDLKPLSLEGLDDVIFSSYDFEERLHEIFHNRFDRRSFRFEDYTTGFEELSHLIREQSKNEFLHLKQQFLKSKSQWNDWLENGKLKGLISKLLDEQADDAPQSSTNDVIPWRVLYVDDNPDDLEFVKRQFAKHKPKIACETASCGTEAIDILRQNMVNGNPVNSINVLIVDYRFLEADQLTWQEYQGYDIIETVRNDLDNSAAFFVLTNKRGKILTQSYRATNPDVNYFLKSNVIDDSSGNKQFEVFADAILNEGEKQFEAVLHSQINRATWTTGFKKGKQFLPLSRLYRMHRMSAFKEEGASNYRQLEDKINKRSKKLLKEARLIKDTFSRDFEHEPELSDDSRFSPMISENSRDPQKMFSNILVWRRVALGLWFMEFTPDEIFSLLYFKSLKAVDYENGRGDPSGLKSGILTLDGKKEMKDPLAEKRKVFSNFLCLPENVFNSMDEDVLIEEKMFLKELGVPIRSVENIHDLAFEIIV